MPNSGATSASSSRHFAAFDALLVEVTTRHVLGVQELAHGVLDQERVDEVVSLVEHVRQQGRPLLEQAAAITYYLWYRCPISSEAYQSQDQIFRMQAANSKLPAWISSPQLGIALYAAVLFLRQNGRSDVYLSNLSEGSERELRRLLESFEETSSLKVDPIAAIARRMNQLYISRRKWAAQVPPQSDVQSVHLHSVEPGLHPQQELLVERRTEPAYKEPRPIKARPAAAGKTGRKPVVKDQGLRRFIRKHRTATALSSTLFTILVAVLVVVVLSNNTSATRSSAAGSSSATPLVPSVEFQQLVQDSIPIDGANASTWPKAGNLFGPARQLYTMAAPPRGPELNSIIDNPAWPREQAYLIGAKDASTFSTLGSRGVVNAAPGDNVALRFF